jgi:hypothetical protein
MTFDCSFGLRGGIPEEELEKECFVYGEKVATELPSWIGMATRFPMGSGPRQTYYLKTIDPRPHSDVLDEGVILQRYDFVAYTFIQYFL